MRLAPLTVAMLLAGGGAAGAAQPASLQQRIAAAAPGARIDVGPGVYDGDVVIDKPLHLVGNGRPLLRGRGDGTVVVIAAPDVSIEGFDIDGRKGGDLGKDASGILVAAPRAVIRDCRVSNALFGIYLKAAPGSRIEHCRVSGIKEKSAGEKGSGIHVWNTDGFVLTDNVVYDVRDGIYIQSSPNGTVLRNVARDLRYGLHYMYSDDNLFEDNVFENADAGTAIMYSKRLAFRRNQFMHNRGFASVGLLLQGCDRVIAEHNLIADNARGVFMEGTSRTTVRENVIAESDVALVVFASASTTSITGNSFVANLAPLAFVGRRTDTSVSGNYWSDNDALDLDGDGRTDQPYRLSSLFDHLRGNLTAADLFSRSLSASALAAAERSFPVLDLTPIVDPSPLARPPVLPVPMAVRDSSHRPAVGGLIASGAVLSVGAAALFGGRRRRAALVEVPA